jgi:uncharacterized membrane protein
VTEVDLWLKWVHVVSSTALFGMGAGIAFFFVRAQRTMVRLAGFPLSLPWLRWSIALYVLIGCCWLPVVWLQVRMRNLAARAMRDGTALPAEHSRYYRWWFYLGWPAFIGVLFVFYLMVVKPAI